MSDNRRMGLSDEELELLADKLAKRLEPTGQCKLTEEQQRAVIDLITAKRKAVRVTLWLIGAIIVWIIKDIYVYIVNHLSFNPGVNP